MRGARCQDVEAPRRNQGARRRRGVRNEKGVSPPQPTVGSRERRKLPQWVCVCIASFENLRHADFSVTFCRSRPAGVSNVKQDSVILCVKYGWYVEHQWL